MNAQELGKFIAYKDSVFIMPFIEGRGLPHDFSVYKNNATFINAKWRKNFVELGGVNRDRYISVPASNSLNSCDNEVTAIVMFRLQEKIDITDQNDYTYLFSKDAWDYWHIFVEQIEGLTTSVMTWDGTTEYRYCILGRDSPFNVYKPKVVFAGLSYSAKDGILKQIYNYAYVTKAKDPLPLNPAGHDGDLRFGHASPRSIPGFVYFGQVWKRCLSDSEVKSSYYHTKRNVKPTCVTRRGVYQAVKNTGIEVDGNMTNVAEVMC